MHLLRTLYSAALLAMALVMPAMAQTRAPLVVLDESFNNISALTTWARINDSSPRGQLWFQGNPGVFIAHRGSTNSYIAADYLSAANGSGRIDNWLISPELTFIGASTLSFFTRGAEAAGFNDMLEIRFSAGADTEPTGFSTLIGTIGGVNAFPDSWQQFSASFIHEGTGRLAFRYVGDAAAANYIGVDSVLVSTVPEIDTYVMLLVGLGAVIFLRRREHIAQQRFGDHHV